MENFIRKMPKVELHVHLEGSVQPATLIKLAEHHNVTLPADNREDLIKWYDFRDFSHFAQIYCLISQCLKTADDIELITREFLIGQAKQNILHSEVTFTPYSQFYFHGLGFHEQMDALERAAAWAEKELNISMSVIIDIPRLIPPDQGNVIADWVTERYSSRIIAMGLGGPEPGEPPEKYEKAFKKVLDAGIPCILHAGETAGPESVWQAIRIGRTSRIGHGVRSVEDPELIEYLRQTQLPLEVCPSSNVCLKIYESLKEHSLPTLMEEGLFVTINSDDPPLFNTSLTQEFIRCTNAFEWTRETIEKLSFNALHASMAAAETKKNIQERMNSFFRSSNMTVG